jgi:hypothetical protein
MPLSLHFITNTPPFNHEIKHPKLFNVSWWVLYPSPSNSGLFSVVGLSFSSEYASVSLPHIQQLWGKHYPNSPRIKSRRSFLSSNIASNT